MVGLDRSAVALQRAKRESAPIAYVQGDMRHLPFRAGSFDAIICLWQSFGYFDADANEAILAQARNLLRPRGRLVLDVYHRGFFLAHQGVRTFIRNGRTICESKKMMGDRLSVDLDYGPDGASDHFEWHLYDPQELCEIASRRGFATLARCANFTPDTEPSAAFPRMQIVFESVNLS
ncbi:MAG TPA: class I SAM-dependent methyltransferase [Humisphaera sp.]|jgi:D-alanine-D-alanine ligase|nr:class I SAM-dependent methyltransferase [Humisphaera sp.]